MKNPIERVDKAFLNKKRERIVKFQRKEKMIAIILILK